MANVLPPAAQKKVWSYYRARFIIIGSAAALCAAAIALIALLPAYKYLLDTSPVTEIVSDGKKIDTIAERDLALETQALIDQISPMLTASSSALAAIQHSLSRRPSGITITRITYSVSKNRSLVLMGTSASRESTNAFKRALEETKAYESVSVPVGDLVGRDTRFTITLSGVQL